MPNPTPIGDTPPDPYEGYRVERIEADRQKKEESRGPRESNQSPFALAAVILHLIHRALTRFREREEKKSSSQPEIRVKQDLLLIQESFEILKVEDRSQDAPFLNRLSALWHEMTEDLSSFHKATLFSQQCKTLIQDIETYPEAEEFKFGYYLTEYAGQKWLPFPYMELVQKIHQEHQALPETSALTRWTELIEAILRETE